MITITVNGKPREITGEMDVFSLLVFLGANPEQVAVAVNGEVVRRRDWDITVVKENDAVEIVRAVGGG